MADYVPNALQMANRAKEMERNKSLQSYRDLVVLGSALIGHLANESMGKLWEDDEEEGAQDAALGLGAVCLRILETCDG
jgi:predicted Zn-dependent protease